MTAMLLSAGCTSTLSEYRCEANADCSGEMVGRCEASGHCSFEDEDCPSGYRFGNKSGEESGLCVDDSDIEPGADAGPNGRPIARISEFDMPCGQTSTDVSGAESEASGFKSLTEFRWRIIGPNSEILDEFAGPRNAMVVPDIHRIDGTYSRPVLNATTYEGRKALRVEVASPPTAGGPTLQQELSSLPIFPIGPVDVALTFSAAGQAGDGSSGSVQIVDSTDAVILDETFSIGPQFQPHRFAAEGVSLLGLSPPITIHFGFNTVGTFYVDNISLFNAATQIHYLRNGSAEESSEPWMYGTDLGNLEAAEIEDIPGAMRQPGMYTTTLRVTDSANETSNIAAQDFTVADCPSPPPSNN